VTPAFLSYGSTFATTAMLAAYTSGGPWLDAAREHVAANVAWLSAYLGVWVPEVVPVPPEATYLVWLDCSALLLLLRRLAPPHPTLHESVLRRARLLLSPGHEFAPGDEAAHFLRMNVACGRPVLRTAAEQLRAAVEALRREVQEADGRGDSDGTL
jgi:cystathionine beta-lyase